MTSAPRPGGFEGDLAALSVVEIVQTLNLGGKTARLTLRAGSGTGTMWFRDGAMTHAATGSLLGELAVWAMVEWTAGRFLVEYGLITETRSIAGDTTQLLLDALRRLDERSSCDEPNPDLREVPPVLEADVRRSRLRRLIFRATAFTLLVGAIAATVLHEAQSSSGTVALAAAPVRPDPTPARSIASEAPPARRPVPARAHAKEKPAVAPPPPVAAPESPLADEPVPTAALVEPEPAPREAALAMTEAPASSQLRISGESHSGGGTLVVLVDGTPVFTHEKLDKNEPFEAEVSVTPGEHVIVARLEGGTQTGIHEDSTRAVFGGGEARLLKVTANRAFGSPVRVKLGRPAPAAGGGPAAL